MPPRHATAADVVDAAAELAAEPTGRTHFIGIDGFGASGKTSLAARIAREVPAVQVVHVDDFARPGVPEWEWDRFEAQVLAPLRAGASARYQVWNWDDDRGGSWLDVQPGGVVVVEGVSSTRAEVRIDWALTVWVDAPRELRLQRAVDRDGPAMLDTWLTLWMPPEEAYARRERPRDRVDLIVDGTAGPPHLGQSNSP